MSCIGENTTEAGDHELNSYMSDFIHQTRETLEKVHFESFSKSVECTTLDSYERCLGGEKTQNNEKAF